MKIALILVLSLMVVSCGRKKPKVEEKKDPKVEAAKAEDKITVCEAYQNLEINHLADVVIKKNEISYDVLTTPGIDSQKHGRCHEHELSWSELDLEDYEEDLPKAGTPKYKELKERCQRLGQQKEIKKYAKKLDEQVKTLDDKQAQGFLVINKINEFGDSLKTLYCSTDFDVYPKAKVEPAKKDQATKK